MSGDHQTGYLEYRITMRITMPRLAAAGRGVLFDTADMKRNGGSKAKKKLVTIEMNEGGVNHEA